MRTMLGRSAAWAKEVHANKTTKAARCCNIVSFVERVIELQSYNPASLATAHGFPFPTARSESPLVAGSRADRAAVLFEGRLAAAGCERGPLPGQGKAFLEPGVVRGRFLSRFGRCPRAVLYRV